MAIDSADRDGAVPQLPKSKANTMQCDALPRTFYVAVVLLCQPIWLSGVGVAQNSAASAPSALVTPADVADGVMPLQLGGVGGVYFLAEPGELIVDVFKQDLKRGNTSPQLRAILVGPDRSLVHEQFLPAPDRAIGTQPTRNSSVTAQRTRFSTVVRNKGVYALNITVANDRYGTSMRWGFRTNCPHYIIETSRGHRDEAHSEPIVVDTPDSAGDICFLPRYRAFQIQLSGLPKSSGQLSVFDGQDQLVQTIEVDQHGKAAHSFAADPQRGDRPWRLHLPAYQATVEIDGVTRWDRSDLYRDLCCWTTNRDAWFPLLEYRWLLTPYQQTINRSDQERAEQTFRVHNNSDEPRTIRLQLEFPHQPWPAKLSAHSVDLAPWASEQVSVNFAQADAGQTHTVHVRATPKEAPDFSTFSTLIVKPSQSSTIAPLELPLTLEPYRHENQQFGYAPTYPLENQVYFDDDNRPYVVTNTQLWRKQAGQWLASDVENARRHGSVGTGSLRTTSSKIAFDGKQGVYLLGQRGRTAVLLHSTDRGVNFTAYAIPTHASLPSGFDFEQFSGNNTPSGPPPIVRFTRTASDPKLIWRKVNQLDLLIPEFRDGQIEFREPVRLSDNCIGFSSHSGIPSAVVSRDENVHIVWGEATAPDQKVPGVPGYVATYNRDTRQLSEPTFVGHGPPANDVHNTPSITLDNEDYLHLLIGTHGHPFPYAHSLQPSGVAGEWTEAQPMSDARQTYVGLVAGPDGTLHSVYRMWRSGEPPHPESHHAVLAYSRKPPGQPWSKPTPLVVAPFSEYSVFYHRLTIDHKGGLWLSYDYWSTFWFYRNDHHGSRRSLLTSPDGGQSWYLATGDRAP